MIGTRHNGYGSYGTYGSLGELRGEVDRLFHDFLDTAPTRARDAWGGGQSPALNVWEDESSFHAEAELPGFKMEELEIFVVKDELTLKGERKGDVAEGVTFHRRERGEDSFSRVLRFPTEIDSEKVQASLKDGVLHITLPKAEKAKPRKIKVAVQ